MVLSTRQCRITLLSVSSSSAFFPHHGFKLTTSRFSRLQNTFQTNFWALSISCDTCHSAGQAVCLNPAVSCDLPCWNNSCPCWGQLICWDDFYSFLFSLPTPPHSLKRPSHKGPLLLSREKLLPPLQAVPGVTQCAASRTKQTTSIPLYILIYSFWRNIMYSNCE